VNINALKLLYAVLLRDKWTFHTWDSFVEELILIIFIVSMGGRDVKKNC